MGEYVGALKDISAIDLGAIAAKGALESTGVAAARSIGRSKARRLSGHVARAEWRHGGFAARCR